MPWKNGLGTTWEIAIDPPGASMTDAQFRWRLSIADVSQSGPFSTFPGIDRTIMVIKGSGMVLTVAGCPPRRLDECFVPYEFSGDATTECELIGGPIQDFNLMVNRSLLSSRTEVLELSRAEIIPLTGDICILHLLAGDAGLRWGSAKERGSAGDTLVLSNALPEALEVIPRSTVFLAMIAMQGP
jgi:environmental stress-induced protein Ves